MRRLRYWWKRRRERRLFRGGNGDYWTDSRSAKDSGGE